MNSKVELSNVLDIKSANITSTHNQSVKTYNEPAVLVGGCVSASTGKKIGLRPLGDRVLVRVEAPPETIVNGILLPDNAVEKPLQGIVVAVGNGRVVNGERIPVDVQVGQKILFGRYAGNEVEVDNIKYLLLQEGELQGCFED